MTKKGGDFEILALDFLEKIFTELSYTVTRKRIQNSGSQDGFDNLIEIVDSKYKSYNIYSECKDYTTELNYTDAMIKLPQIHSTHKKVDLMLFISPKRNFSNIHEATRNKPFLENLTNNGLRVDFLSPETFVHDYFSLYPEIYKKVYSNDVPILSEEDRCEILNRFDKFIFSNQNLNKIVIDDSDKEKFIRKIQNENFHIERTIRNTQNRGYVFYKSTSEKNILNSCIKEAKSGIVLLGNPGYGKSSELKQFALDLWESRNENTLIPVFYVLKNFSSSSNITDFLPDNYKFIENLIVILDGIDELENIIDFSNKLRNFISDNKEYIKDSKMKFLISCRTNVYRKYIKSINDFETWFLDEIDIPSAVQFLDKKFNVDIREHKSFDIYKHQELLENPFYLELIGKYYKTHKILLTNKAKLIDEYVELRLNEDKEVKYQNDINFDTDRIISYTQKIAFALEAMQKPNLNSSEIKRVIKIDEKEFAKNPFLEENLDGTWSFVHKNIQEYFVAKMLKNLTFEQIIEFIRIDSYTNKIHPTWYNVIAFLLNLDLDKNLYDSLIQWLLDNDFELLFNADSNRVSDQIKNRVLQNFFTKKCIEETLWINDAREIALFSESESNIEYLITNIKNIDIHRRARMSAIKILSYVEINEKYHSELKEIVLDIINEDNFEDENYLYLKQDAIMLIGSLGLNNDIVFFDTIISNLKDRDNKEIISSILHSVPSKSVENNISYFLEILDKAIGNKNWKVTSKYNSATSTKERLFKLFEKIKNPELLIIIYTFLIERHQNSQIRENLIKDFLKHLESVFRDRTEYHEKLTNIISDAVINNKIRYYEDDLLIDLVKSCNIGYPVFFKIFYSIIGNSSNKHFLADIVKEEYFNEILNRYNEKILNNDFIKEFRNVVSHKDVQLSIKFETLIENKTDYRFLDKISTIDIENNTQFWKTKDQKNFDTLFNNESIVEQISKIYSFLGSNELSYNDIKKFRRSYYENFDLQKEITENSKHLLIDILRESYKNDEKLNIKDLPNVIVNLETDIIYDILNSLPENGKKNNLIVSQVQINFMKNWCIKKTDEVNSNYLNHFENKEIWSDHKYYLFESVFKFQKIFKFDLDETLLLNMLWFNDIEDGINIDYMVGVVSEEKINQRILDNLKLGITDKISYCNHIKYCIENNIDFTHLNLDLKGKIYYFLNSDSYHYALELLKKYFEKNSLILNEFLNYQGEINYKNHFLDGVISILWKNENENIIERFLLDNYNTLLKNNVYQEIEIIRKLISLNSEGIFNNFYELLKLRIENSVSGGIEFRDNEWQKYTKESAIDALIKIVELNLSTPNIENLFDKFSQPIRIATETIINICKANKVETCSEVLNKLEKIDFNKIKTAGGDLFYYNKLRNDILEIYYNHKSKPFPFTDVLKILDQNKYLFVD
nr:hypothetical protein [uncultured Flavobacterium sp.]